MHAKFRPGFDAVWLGLLEADTDASLVLISEAGQAAAKLLPRLQRLAAARWCGVPVPAVDVAARAWTAEQEPPVPSAETAASVLRELLAPQARPSGNCTADAYAAVEGRVVRLELTDHATFVRLLGAVDVLVDPWPFGGGLLSYEGLALGHTPVVTLPSGVRSGRLTHALLRRMGLDARVRGGWPVCAHKRHCWRCCPTWFTLARACACVPTHMLTGCRTGGWDPGGGGEGSESARDG